MAKSKKKPLHKSIRLALGYDDKISDKDLLADWKKKSTHVCKPCWELKYCPYGPFVEQSPLLPVTLDVARIGHTRDKQMLESNTYGTVRDISAEEIEDFKLMVKHPQSIIPHVHKRLVFNKLIDNIGETDPEPFKKLFDPGEWKMAEYQVPYSFKKKKAKKIKMTPELKAAVALEISRMKDAIKTGKHDNRLPLDKHRRALFEKSVKEYDESKFPETIPEVFTNMACNIFGHICPVVFVGENITETETKRRKGRYISFKTKMRVVRRDNYTCQECGKHLKDNEVEFDHVIPVAKGGSSEEHNIRLTCFDCNRDKSDKVQV